MAQAPRNNSDPTQPDPTQPVPEVAPGPPAPDDRESFARRLGGSRYGWRTLVVSTAAALALGGAAGAGIHALADHPGPGDRPGGPAMHHGPGGPEGFDHPGHGRSQHQAPPRGEQGWREDGRGDRDAPGPSTSPSPEADAGGSASPADAV